MSVVLRTAAMLLPYQRPTYRSIEVHTDKGISPLSNVGSKR
jgi:hypothetical protein